MANVLIDTCEEVEARMIRRGERPIAFETFLELNVDCAMELIDGVMVKRMAAHLAHEKLLAWLFSLINTFVRHKRLGVALLSRTTVRINAYRGRLPDLLFVQESRLAIVQQHAVIGAPDLVIELISPNDRPSDIIALETDYCSLGVPEIVFVDQQKRYIRILHKRESGYEEIECHAGAFDLETISGFILQADWLFDEPRPDEFDLLTALLNP